MRKYLTAKVLIAFILALISVIGCKRENTDLQTPIPEIVNDAVQVTANVSGFVLDESNLPIVGATVNSGTASTITDAFGSFSFRNISLSKQNGSVSVTKGGYFKGVRSFKTSEGKDHIVKIQLMQKVLSGTLTASSGGIINSNGGSTLNFPANSFVNNSGVAHNGTVHVYSRWIDPTANNLSFIVPGDLRGVTISGTENILETFGMVGAEIEDASGNPLKLASGKSATVNFPIPIALNATAPESIALWHFDNSTARWKEEGTAVKSGSNYSAQVNKFSFWNCDRGFSDLVELDYTLINSITNSPMVGTITRLRIASGNAIGYGVTNNIGFVQGLVPKNETFVLEVMSASCSTPVFSQSIGPFTSNTSLGNINVTLPPSLYINFTGTIVNCSNTPVTNGYLSLYGAGGNSGFANTDASGNFSFTILNCTSSSLPYSCAGVDINTTQQSTIVTGTASSATVNLGTIMACSAPAPVSVYIAGFEPIDNTTNNAAKVWKDGVATVLSNGITNGLAYGVYVSGNDVYVCGREINQTTNNSIARVWKNGSVLYNLTDGTDIGQAHSIAVSGTDVYVAGSDGTGPKVWKNGIATSLPGGNAITVVGTDVYVAGSENYRGKVWKNGVALFPLTTLPSEFISLFVSGTDVYVAGRESDGSGYVATVWKNGVATVLDNGTTESQANGVFVSGTDVYVAGRVTNTTGFFTVAKLWKNGVPTDLTNGSRFGNAEDVIIAGTDVYVLGTDQYTSGINTIIVWKNNLPINITDGTLPAFCTSLFIK